MFALFPVQMHGETCDGDVTPLPACRGYICRSDLKCMTKVLGNMTRDPRNFVCCPALTCNCPAGKIRDIDAMGCQTCSCIDAPCAGNQTAIAGPFLTHEFARALRVFHGRDKLVQKRGWKCVRDLSTPVCHVRDMID